MWSGPAMAMLGVLVTPEPFYRPQYPGKVERSHQRVLKHLNAARSDARAIGDTALKGFRDHYSHQVLSTAITPAAAYAAATRAKPRTEPIVVNMLRDRCLATTLRDG